MNPKTDKSYKNHHHTLLKVICALQLCAISNFAYAGELTVCNSGCTHTTIQAAVNNSTDGDVISITDAVHTEAGITINLAGSLTIKGAGLNQTTVQAAATLATSADRVFSVSGGNIQFENIIIHHGKAIFGGGIEITNSSNVTIQDSAIVNNQATSIGGGISFSGGVLKIIRSEIAGNIAIDAGGLHVNSGELEMVESSIRDNVATGAASTGGLLIESSGTQGNIRRSTLSQNEGVLVGGVYIGDSVKLGIINTTIAKNVGQGIYSRGILLVSNSTITNNNISGTLTYGIKGVVGAITIKNSIISGSDQQCEIGVAATLLVANSPNMSSDNSCSGFTFPNVDPNLDDLHFNGGYTRTTRPKELFNSVINKGVNCETLDQRGVDRRRESSCDLGAYERILETSCNNAVTAIPDNSSGGVNSILNLSNLGVEIVEVDVGLTVTHTYIGDLKASIQYQGDEVVLIDRLSNLPPILGQCDGQGISAIFDDTAISAATDQCGSNPPALYGLVTPLQPLALFSGKTLDASNWTLNVSDNASSDIGSINEWCVFADLYDSRPYQGDCGFVVIPLNGNKAVTVCM